MYPFTSAIYDKMQGKLIQKYQTRDHTEVFKRNQLQVCEKEYWRLKWLRNMVFHHPLARRQFVGFCKMLSWNGLIFRGNKSWPKMTWNWDLSLFKKFVVNVQCATMKHEIISKPMILKRVQVNSLKSANYY